METTLLFPDYRRENAKLDDPHAESSGQHDFEGLSAFNIPVSIAVVVIPDADRCIFRFEYSDNEEGSGPALRLPGSDSLYFMLGENTKKVIEAHVDNARHLLTAGVIDFDPRLAMAWAKDFPHRQSKILLRNMVVIANILHEMPDRLRQQIVKTLTHPPKQSSAGGV